MGMRWAGFRKVRGQVCKRISRRLDDLGLGDAQSYRSYLDTHDEEWGILGSLCRVTISRFYRDRGVFDGLVSDVLPAQAQAAAGRGQKSVRCWSAGCASGEEPYTLSIVWVRTESPVAVEIVATDSDDGLLDRARSGRYHYSSLKDLPDELRTVAFDKESGEYAIKDEFRCAVRFERRDVRGEPPAGPFDLILCRNLAFTYFDDDGQRVVLDAFRRVLNPGGVLVLGVHEQLPEGGAGFERLPAVPGAYRFISE